MGRVREFVAIDVGEAGGEGVRIAPAHLTLRFLGEVDPARNAGIVEALGRVASAVPPFTLQLQGVGAFPSARRPRVVWQGVGAGRAELVDLAQRVRTALEPEFGPDREAFVPHLTLFRVRSPRDLEAALELLSRRRIAPPAREARVSELLLKESVLGARGAVHQTLAAVPLGRETAGSR